MDWRRKSNERESRSEHPVIAERPQDRWEIAIRQPGTSTLLLGERTLPHPNERQVLWDTTNCRVACIRAGFPFSRVPAVLNAEFPRSPIAAQICSSRSLRCPSNSRFSTTSGRHRFSAELFLRGAAKHYPTRRKLR